jgi:flagellar biosynthesis protein FliR
MGRFFVAVGIFYFWVLDYFGLLILGLRESFFIVPAMGVGLLNEVSGWVRFSAGIFTGALVMAAPIIALSFAISVATGILARSVQGLNLFFEIFALRVVVGIGAVIFFLPLLLGMMRQQFETLIPMAGSVVRYFTGVGV